MSTPIAYCKLCGKSVPGTYYGNNWKQHRSGKRHSNQLPHMITVEGVSDTVDLTRISSYFGKYGRIIGFSPLLSENKINFVFEDRNVYTDIIQDDHRFDNVKLTISWSNKPEAMRHVANYKDLIAQQLNQTPAVNEKEVALTWKLSEDNKSVLKILKDRPFLEQVHILYEKLKPDSESNKCVRIVFEDLETTISSTYPLSKIHFFGSGKLGLNLSRDKVKCYIANVRPPDQSEETVLTELSKIITDSGRFSNSTLSENASGTLILKTKHFETQIWCEVNVKNIIPVYHTELIRYYLSMDEKLPILVTAIKYWSDCYNLTKHSFSSYVLCLMVIFYLQQEPYNLPSVSHLQEISSDRVIINGWNCHFDIDHNFKSTTLRGASFFDLFLGFFQFYCRFDYFSDVICPYYGKIIRKVDFLRNQLPVCYDFYQKVSIKNSDLAFKISSGLCIQDVFELCRNISVSSHSVAKFVKMCKEGLQFASLPDTQVLLSFLKNCETPPLTMQFSFDILLSPETDRPLCFSVIKMLISTTMTEVFYCESKKFSRSPDSLYFYLKGKPIEIDDGYKVEPPRIESKFLDEIYTTKLVTDFHKISSFFDVVITVFFKDQPFRIEIFIRQLQSTQHFSTLTHFLELKLGRWWKVLEEEFSMIEEMLNETSKVNEQHKSEVVEEEDVPDDFFDDLLREDFIEDLDIAEAIDCSKSPELSEGEIRSSSNSPCDNIEKQVVEEERNFKSRKRSLSGTSSDCSSLSSGASSRRSRRRKRKRRKHRKYYDDDSPVRVKLSRRDQEIMEEIKQKINEVRPAPFVAVSQVAPYQVYQQQYNVLPNNQQWMYPEFQGNSNQVSSNNKDVAKDIEIMFAEKKISLSDFLQITKKSEGSVGSLKTDNKTRIINRCEEALQILRLNHNITPRGAFIVKYLSKANKYDGKHPSPLRSNLTTAFKFASRSRGRHETYTSSLFELLQKIGLETRSLDDPASNEDVMCIECKRKLVVHNNVSVQVSEWDLDRDKSKRNKKMNRKMYERRVVR